MILAHVPSWDLKRIPNEGEDVDENAAVVVDMDGPVQTMNPNIMRINNPYIDSNPENPQPRFFMYQPHQLISIPPPPTDLNIEIQIGAQPAPNRANLNISKSQRHYNPSAPVKYTPHGSAATGNGEIEIGQPI